MFSLGIFVLDFRFFFDLLSFYKKVRVTMRDRLMVGHIPLEDGILVRIQVPQQG